MIEVDVKKADLYRVEREDGEVTNHQDQMNSIEQAVKSELNGVRAVIKQPDLVVELDISDIRQEEYDRGYAAGALSAEPSPEPDPEPEPPTEPPIDPPVSADWDNTMESLPIGWDEVRAVQVWDPRDVPESKPVLSIRDGILSAVAESYHHLDNGFASDGVIFKDILETKQLYFEILIKFQPGWAGADGFDQGQCKMLRFFKHHGGERQKFFTTGNAGPLALFDWHQNQYGARHFYAVRGGHPSEHYYGAGVGDSPRSFQNGDATLNFTADIWDNDGTQVEIPDQVNGGIIPWKVEDIVKHNQIWGDGLWNKLSVYLQMNSAADVWDGHYHAWINESKIAAFDYINWLGPNADMTWGWDCIGVGGNDRFHFLDSGSETFAPSRQREIFYDLNSINMLDYNPDP